LAGLGCSLVRVDHAAEDSMASERGVEGDHHGWIVLGRVLVEALVWTVVVEMADILVEDGVGVSLMVDQHPVSAFLADAANEPFRIAVRSRCLGRDLGDVDAFGGEDGVEGGGELAVPVTDEEAKRGDLLTEVHQQVAGGLGGQSCGGMGGYTEQVHLGVRTSMRNRT
jgi:hypothetical protein